MFAEEQVECRRVQLLQHFAEHFDAADCKGTCDICRDNLGAQLEKQVRAEVP
jgi:bloom syndrome protein